MQDTIVSSEDDSRRMILIVDDNELNRDILSAILEDYRIISAANGLEALAQLAKHHKELSLVVLDIYMPVCSGFEFLEKLGGNPLLSTVPVIVATASDRQEDEKRCLQLGAVDFIIKPFSPDIVRSRINSIIRFRESVEALSAVEHDEITGLYTMQAFYHRVGQIIAHRKTEKYTMVAVDIHSSRLISEVFGRQKAEETLCYVADLVRSNPYTDLCARSDDIFYLFLGGSHWPEASVFDKTYPTVFNDAPVPNLQLKVGIYADVDTGQPPAVLCRRAVLATKKIRSSLGEKLAFYDEAMHAALLEEQLIESSFPEALHEGQLRAYYQPKVDAITGRVVGAEALARWCRHDGTLLSPGRFIPLLERNGQVAVLDEYMFRQVCLFQQQRLRAGKQTVPISINLSRCSIFQRDALERYLEIVRQTEIPLELVPLELTESASTDGLTTIHLANQFAGAGFRLHLDDFGTGTSTLASVTAIPFSVIKMDRSLTEQIGTSKGDVLVEHLIMIAHGINVQIVAEGVETRSQAHFLRSVDCDEFQGFYFGSPKTECDFTQILDRL